TAAGWSPRPLSSRPPALRGRRRRPIRAPTPTTPATPTAATSHRSAAGRSSLSVQQRRRGLEGRLEVAAGDAAHAGRYDAGVAVALDRGAHGLAVADPGERVEHPLRQSGLRALDIAR